MVGYTDVKDTTIDGSMKQPMVMNMKDGLLNLDQGCASIQFCCSLDSYCSHIQDLQLRTEPEGFDYNKYG